MANQKQPMHVSLSIRWNVPRRLNYLSFVCSFVYFGCAGSLLCFRLSGCGKRGLLFTEIAGGFSARAELSVPGFDWAPELGLVETGSACRTGLLWSRGRIFQDQSWDLYTPNSGTDSYPLHHQEASGHSWVPRTQHRIL